MELILISNWKPVNFLFFYIVIFSFGLCGRLLCHICLSVFLSISYISCKNGVILILVLYCFLLLPSQCSSL